MTLDSNHPLWEHTRDRDQAQLAALRVFEREDRDRHRADLAERDALESIEAEEQKWVGIRQQMPPWVAAIRYQGDAG